MFRLLIRASKLMSRAGIYPFIASELSGTPSGGRILNVGAGGDVIERILPIARRLQLQLISTDIDPARDPDCVDDITQSKFPDSQFDVLVAIEVLEHVLDPVSAASEMYRIIKPGGRIVISTPFIFPLHDRPYDYYRFTKYGLEYLFRKFDDVKIEERNSWAEAMIVLIARFGSVGGLKGAVGAFVAIPIALVLWPVAFALGAILKSDFLTTGYTLSAHRPIMENA